MLIDPIGKGSSKDRPKYLWIRPLWTPRPPAPVLPPASSNKACSATSIPCPLPQPSRPPKTCNVAGNSSPDRQRHAMLQETALKRSDETMNYELRNYSEFMWMIQRWWSSRKFKPKNPPIQKGEIRSSPSNLNLIPTYISWCCSPSVPPLILSFPTSVGVSISSCWSTTVPPSLSKRDKIAAGQV